MMQFADVEFEMCRANGFGDGPGCSACDGAAVLGGLVSGGEERVRQRVGRQFPWQVADVPQLVADPIRPKLFESEFTGERHEARYRRRIFPTAEGHDESLGSTFTQ